MEQQDFGKEEEIRTLDRELLLRRVLTENKTLKEEISALREQLAYLKKMMYGQKSEKTEVIMENGVQLSVFDEAEQEACGQQNSEHQMDCEIHGGAPFL